MRAELRCAFLALAIACSGLAIRPALAEPGDAGLCENGTDSAVVIAACTPIIEAGGTRELSLALALDDRCSARNDLGKFDLALQDCNAALRLNGDFARTYDNRGNAYAGKEQYELAIRDYDSAIRRDPHFDYAYYNRGLAYEALGNYAQAIKDYTAAIRVNPNDTYDYLARCYGYALVGEAALAISDCDKSLELNPVDASIVLDGRGYAHLRAGDLDRAIADYNAADAAGAPRAATRRAGRICRQSASAGSRDVRAPRFACFLVSRQIRSGAIMIPVRNSG